MDKLGIVLEMNRYASLLEHLSELERVDPEGAGAEFAKFTETVKEIISDFPAGAEGVKKAKQLVLTVLNDKEEVIKTRLNAVCEQCRNAQVQAEQRASRKLPTPVRGIVDTVARSFVDDKTLGVSGFDDLSDDAKGRLKKKVVSLHRRPPDREKAREINEYSIGDEGMGIFSVAGADTLVASVNKRVNETISEVNALAQAAGIEAGIESLNETRRYRVSDLLDLDDKLAGWAWENPCLMELIGFQEELSTLAKLKSSDDERAKTVHRKIDETLNNIIVACIDGEGDAVALLRHLVLKVPEWKNAAVNEAKPSCDYVTKKALELVGAMTRLQGLQEGDSVTLPELSGKGVVFVISALEPLVACCADQTTTVDKLDESYFKAVRTLSEQRVQFKDISCILSAYCSGALTTAKSRMRELSYCMDKGDAASDRAGAKAQKAKEFAVAINSCDQLKLLKTVADDAKEFDQKYCQALTTLMKLEVSAKESARVISDHLNGFPGGGGVDDLVKEMADTLPMIPHSNPVTEGYVGVIRDCSHHIKALKKAGDSIELMEDAKSAINGFAAVLIQQPEIANLDKALKGVNQWIKEQKDSGKQFQPTGSALSRLTGFAQRYDCELVRATEAVSQLCKDFDVCLEKFHQTGDDSKIGLQEWIDDNQLSPQLAEAFIKRARLSEDSTVVALPEADEAQVVAGTTEKQSVIAVGKGSDEPEVGAHPPPPPPPPVGMAAGSNMKSEVAGQKPKLAPKPKSGAATLPTSSQGRIIFDFSNVKLKKTIRGPKGALKGAHDPKNALMAEIRQGKKLKKTDNSRNSPEQSARLESKDQKEKNKTG